MFCQLVLLLAIMMLPLASGELYAQSFPRKVADSTDNNGTIRLKLNVGRKILDDVGYMLNNVDAKNITVVVVVGDDSTHFKPGEPLWTETIEQQEITIGEQSNTIRELTRIIREQGQTIIEYETLIDMLYDSLEILGGLGRGQSITILGKNDTIEKHTRTIDTLNQTVSKLLEIILQKDDTIKILKYAADPNNWDSTVPCGLRAGRVVVKWDTLWLECDTALVLAGFADTSRHKYRRNITIEVRVFRLEIAWDSNISGWQFQFPWPDPGPEKQPRDSLARENWDPFWKRWEIDLGFLRRDKHARDKSYFAMLFLINMSNQIPSFDGTVKFTHPEKVLPLLGLGIDYFAYYNRDFYFKIGMGGLVNGCRYIVSEDEIDPTLLDENIYKPLYNLYYVARLELCARWEPTNYKNAQPYLSLGMYHAYLLDSHIEHDMDFNSSTYPYIYDPVDYLKLPRIHDSRFTNYIQKYTYGLLLEGGFEFRDKWYMGAKYSVGLRSVAGHPGLKVYDTVGSVLVGINIGHPTNKNRNNRH